MDSFRRDLFIDMVVDTFIFKNNLSPLFHLHTWNKSQSTYKSG